MFNAAMWLQMSCGSVETAAHSLSREWEGNVMAEMNLQFPAWAECLFRPMRYKIIRGGRGSAKSHSVARALVLKAAERKLRILCTREFQNSITESCLELLSSQIRKMGLRHKFEILAQSIRGANGSEFLFIGVGSNPEKVMSAEGIDIVWCEQAERMSERSWEILVPTVREPGSEIWATLNPDEENDPTYRRFVTNKPPDCISLEVNWRENPWFPPELERERAYLYSVDPESAECVWGGRPRTNQSAQILRGKYAIETFATPNPATDKSIDGPFYGADWGYANDPTVLIRCWTRGAEFGKTQGTLLIEYEAYGVHCEIKDTPALFDTIPGAREHMIFADCSLPSVISHVRNAGFRIEGAEKWSGSIEDGVKFLRSFEKIIIHSRCVHTHEEARLWSFRQDKRTGIVMPDLKPGNDHCWDSVRYALAKLIPAKSGLAIWQRLDRPMPFAGRLR
jgi:phage terminase large subunit